MHLNEDCTYQPYVLGQLFYVLEQIQLASVDYQINRSIKDAIFVRLAPLLKLHLIKLFRLVSTI